MQSESCRLDKRQRPAPVKHGPVLFKFIYTEWRGGVETERGRNYFESKFDRSATFFAILSWNLENTKLERRNLLSLVSQLYARTHTSFLRNAIFRPLACHHAFPYVSKSRWETVYTRSCDLSNYETSSEIPPVTNGLA